MKEREERNGESKQSETVKKFDERKEGRKKKQKVQEKGKKNKNKNNHKNTEFAPNSDGLSFNFFKPRHNISPLTALSTDLNLSTISVNL